MNYTLKNYFSQNSDLIFLVEMRLGNSYLRNETRKFISKKLLKVAKQKLTTIHITFRPIYRNRNYMYTLKEIRSA